MMKIIITTVMIIILALFLLPFDHLPTNTPFGADEFLYWVLQWCPLNLCYFLLHYKQHYIVQWYITMYFSIYPWHLTSSFLFCCCDLFLSLLCLLVMTLIYNKFCWLLQEPFFNVSFLGLFSVGYFWLRERVWARTYLR